MAKKGREEHMGKTADNWTVDDIYLNLNPYLKNWISKQNPKIL